MSRYNVTTPHPDPDEAGELTVEVDFTPGSKGNRHAPAEDPMLEVLRVEDEHGNEIDLRKGQEQSVIDAIFDDVIAAHSDRVDERINESEG